MRFIHVVVCAMLFLIVHVFRVGVIPEVEHTVIRWVSIIVTHGHALWPLSQKSLCHQVGNYPSPRLAINLQADKKPAVIPYRWLFYFPFICPGLAM